MADLPSEIMFTCESCEKQFKPAAIRKISAVCKKCGGSTWTLHASYVDVEEKQSAAGTASLVAFGVGWSKVNTYSNNYMLEGLGFEIANWLTESKHEVPQRVAKLIRDKEIEKSRQGGSINCKQCKVLFRPAKHKSWMVAGFCSAKCSLDGGRPVSQAEIKCNAGGEGSKANVTMTCSNGHEFSVMRSFSGCKRPCPVCDEKCLVP